MAVINNGSFTLATSGLTSSQGIQYYDSGSFRVGNGNSTTLIDTRKHIDVDRLYLGNDNSTITLTDCGINVRNTGNSFGNNFVAGIDNSTLSLTRCAVYSASRLIMITTDGQTVLRDSVFNIPGLALYAVDTQISNITITGMSFSSANGFGIRNTYTTPIQNVLIKDCGIGFNLFSTFGGTIKNTTLSNVTNDFYIQTGYSGLIKAVNLAANWVLSWEGGSTSGSIQRINTYDLTVIDNSNTAISGMRVYLANVAGTQVFNDVTNGSGVISQQELIRNIYTHGGSGTTATETRTPYVKRLRQYGYRFFEDLSFDFSQAVTDQVKVLDNDYVVAADSATALAVTNPTTANQIYDHSQATYATSSYMQYAAPITTVAGMNLTFDLNVTINSELSTINYTPATPAVSVSAISMGTFSTLTLGANRTIDLAQNATYDEKWSVPATGTLTVADGTTNLSTWEFGDGAEINLRSGATSATVTVATGQSANIVAGSGVTLVEPSLAVTVTNLIDATCLKIYETGTATLVDGTNSSSTSFVWETGTPGEAYDIYAVLPGYGSIFIETYTYPNDSATLPITQEIDTNYIETSNLVLSSNGSGLGTTEDIYLNTASKQIQIASGANLLSTTGLSLRDLYSFIIEQRYVNDNLMPYHDPVEAVSFAAGEYELRRGWTLADSTTVNILRDGGLRVWNSANDTVLKRYINISGLGSLISTVTPYYWQTDSYNATTINTVNTGLPNQLVQVYEDGSYDYRDVFRLAVRKQGEVYAYYDLIAEQDISQLRSQRYFIPLRTTVDPNINTADVSIDANADGTADISPFDGMSITWLSGSGFTSWSNNTVYTPNSVVNSAGRWYITTAGGTSSGTGVADDSGVTWTNYSGERQIDSTYYAFNIIVDANGASRDNIREFIAWSMRQSVDIDAGSGTKIGKVVTGLYSSRGEDLILGTGVYADDFDITDQLSIIPTDVTGTERSFPVPPDTQTITGIPNVLNAILAVRKHSDSSISYPTITSGSASYLVDIADTYTVMIDAPGYLRQQVTLAGTVPSFTATLEDYRTLYESGTNKSDDILFDYETLMVTILDGTSELTFADVFRTLEDYLATEDGVLFPNPPFPVIVDLGSGTRNYLFFPYDSVNDIVNPVAISPDSSNTINPTFTDFVIVLEGADAPLFDIFDFSSANGKVIHFQTDAVASVVNVSGGLSTEDRAVIDAIEGYTERLNALLENVSGDRFTAKALEQAPSGGSGTAPTEAEIYTYFTTSNRQDTFKADVTPLSTQSSVDDLATSISNIPTTTEFNSRTLPSADYFNPSTDSVTVATNNDKTGYSLTQSFPTNFSALSINASGYINRVVLVDTTTTNADMRGTDSALLATDYIAPDNSTISNISSTVNNLPLENDIYDYFSFDTRPNVFKADISTLSTLDVSDVSTVFTTLGYTSTRAGYLDKLNVIGVLANTDNADTFKADTVDIDSASIYTYFTSSNRENAFKADINGLSTLNSLDIETILVNQGYTTTRAGYLDKLNIVGTLANTDNANLFKAAEVTIDPEGIYTYFTDSNRADVFKTDISGLSVLDSSDITTLVTNVLTSQGFTTTRAAYIDKLNVTGVLANTDNADSFKAGTVTVDLSDITSALDFLTKWAVADEVIDQDSGEYIKYEAGTNTVLVDKLNVTKTGNRLEILE